MRPADDRGTGAGGSPGGPGLLRRPGGTCEPPGRSHLLRWGAPAAGSLCGAAACCLPGRGVRHLCGHHLEPALGAGGGSAAGDGLVPGGPEADGRRPGPAVHRPGQPPGAGEFAASGGAFQAGDPPHAIGQRGQRHPGGSRGQGGVFDGDGQHPAPRSVCRHRPRGQKVPGPGPGGLACRLFENTTREGASKRWNRNCFTNSLPPGWAM